MLSHHERQEVINILNDTLGIGTSMKNDEQAHHCPFCHHHKKKLQINLKTQQWHCWVCDAKGKRIQRLLKRLNVNTHKLKKIYEIYGDDYVVYSKESEEEKVELRLPKSTRWI
jgi:ribosomal protein L37AE/L43A